MHPKTLIDEPQTPKHPLGTLRCTVRLRQLLRIALHSSQDSLDVGGGQSNIREVLGWESLESLVSFLGFVQGLGFRS